MAEVFDNTVDKVEEENMGDIIRTYFLPDNTYKILKWVGLIFCPALATFYGTCAPLWGWPNPNEVVTTINAFGLLIGALVGVSAATVKVENA